MSEWITHRLPTVSDLVGVEREVWYYCTDQGFASRCHWSDIERLGEPWQPITTPAPYVKPKRWTVDFSEYDNTWIMRDNVEGWVRLLYIDRCHGDAAQRIADIYNEVKP
jgi:hypothetical protein